MRRRDLLTAGSLLGLAARSAQGAGAAITILPAEPIGTISPLLHGHFVEHLGGVVYDGIWVGENSSIPNVAGLRKSLIDALKKIKAPLFRWPGGCFADSYSWRDGVGPRAQRPKTTNFWANNQQIRNQTTRATYDSNEFGTNEFMRFCQEVGGAAYIAANVRSGTPREFYEWVEYCNSPAGSTTLAQLRGTPPFNVQYWGIGNESWGCGGDFTGEEYSTEFRKFTSWIPGYGIPLRLIPAGPNGGDLEWTRGFLSGLTRKSPRLVGRVWGFALHYYCGTTGKGQALDFTETDWNDLVTRAIRMESLIAEHWALMGQYDPERRMKLAVDEWGTWHRSGSEVAPHHLFGQNATMRDAVIAALTLDTFHRHADKVSMANIAQLINCLQSLFLAHEDKFMVTPNYHVFDLYQAHHNRQAVRAVFGAPARTLSGSASVKDKNVVLTFSNVHATQPVEAVIEVAGAKLVQGSGYVLSAATLQAHNTFAQPDAVKVTGHGANLTGGVARVVVPPASVMRFTFDFA